MKRQTGLPLAVGALTAARAISLVGHQLAAATGVPALVAIVVLENMSDAVGLTKKALAKGFADVIDSFAASAQQRTDHLAVPIPLTDGTAASADAVLDELAAADAPMPTPREDDAPAIERAAGRVAATLHTSRLPALASATAKIAGFVIVAFVATVLGHLVVQTGADGAWNCLAVLKAWFENEQMRVDVGYGPDSKLNGYHLTRCLGTLRAGGVPIALRALRPVAALVNTVKPLKHTPITRAVTFALTANNSSIDAGAGSGVIVAKEAIASLTKVAPLIGPWVQTAEVLCFGYSLLLDSYATVPLCGGAFQLASDNTLTHAGGAEPCCGDGIDAAAVQQQCESVRESRGVDKVFPCAGAPGVPSCWPAEARAAELAPTPSPPASLSSPTP